MAQVIQAKPRFNPASAERGLVGFADLSYRLVATVGARE
jgi:hypothetical protein